MLDLKQPLFRHQQLPWQRILRIIWTYFLVSSTDNQKTKQVTPTFWGRQLLALEKENAQKKNKKKEQTFCERGKQDNFLFSRNFLLQNFFIFSLAALFNSNKILRQYRKIGGHRTCFLVKYFEISQIPKCVLVVVKSCTVLTTADYCVYTYRHQSSQGVYSLCREEK